MKIVAVIEKNRCYFDKIEEFAAPLLYTDHTDDVRKKLKTELNDYIWSVMEPFITFIKIEDDDDFMSIVCENITKCFPDRNPGDLFYHTESSYSCPKRFIEFIYGQPIWENYETNKIENMNNLACLFSLKHHVVENNCVVIVNNYDLSSKHFADIDSVTKYDLIRIIRRRFFYSAIVIKENKMVKYYYQNPGYLINKVFGLNEEDSIQKLSFSHIKYNLLFYFQQDKSKYINQIATRINGLHRVHGDILVLHEMEDNLFTNISRHEMKRLNVLSYGRLYDRQLKDNEIHTVPKIEVDKDGQVIETKVTPLWSRYIVSNHRMINWQKNKNKCINCDNDMKTIIVCDKCYRVKYCSEQCQKEFASYHNDECITIH